MKNLLVLIVITCACLFGGRAYALENFHYKTIALDSVGQTVDSQVINVRVTIEELGTTLFRETHNNIHTDQFGFFSIEVGGGNVITPGLNNIVTTANKLISIETQVTGAGWVLSIKVQLSDIVTSLLNELGNYSWLLDGNAGTNTADNFLGTTDDVDLVFKINNENSGRINRNRHNTSLGYQTLNSVTNASNNTAIGYQSLFNDTTGWSNTAIGNQALYTNTFRGNLVAIGDSALFNNGKNFSQVIPGVLDSIKAIRNVAVGSKALFTNTVGYWNTAIGYNTAYYNTYGKSLTAVGTEALMHNITGKNNSAVGTWALYGNEDGNWNTGLGSGALKSNVSGDSNTAVGVSAMYYNNGDGNVGVGMFAAAFNSLGHSNTAIGTRALYHNASGSNNVALGYNSGKSYWYRNYHNSIFIGAYADANFDGATNSIAIGYGTSVTASNQVRIGNNSTASLYCMGAYNSTSSNQPNMFVDNQGHIMRSTTSDRLFNNLAVNGNIVSNLIPDGTTRNLGSSSNRWGDLFLSGNSLHIGSAGNEAEIQYTANSHLKFTKPVLTPNSIVSLTGNATYTGIPETGLVLYVYNTSGTNYTFESINVPNGQMKIFVYTGSAWVASN